jgi:hypothetical protein
MCTNAFTLSQARCKERLLSGFGGEAPNMKLVLSTEEGCWQVMTTSLNILLLETEPD